MSQIEDAMDGLMTAIRNSEEFIRYQAIKEKVHGFPKLESQITEFRKKNYLLQNSQGTVDLYEETVDDSDDHAIHKVEGDVSNKNIVTTS